MNQDDVATEILSLYKALRSTADERLQQAIKDRIDLLIEQSHRTFRPTPMDQAQVRPPKLNG